MVLTKRWWVGMSREDVVGFGGGDDLWNISMGYVVERGGIWAIDTH